ncbi:hypothetical protein [Virgibacillus salexigens]|uniref:Uncharacterized protein n=1 Tax=Virgibacillus kapii TaxID=1638645 RepID=A0ABQ2D1K0_9BACI|nr:hypothetical protein [Virgibacillus kapii]GGJ41873.1 hypothetical protein GCM10007111_00080 [Virgibacillus kapii]
MSLVKENVSGTVVNAAQKADDAAVTYFSAKSKDAGFVKSSVTESSSGAGKHLDDGKDSAKGTGNGITKDEYKNLRKKTPSNDVRKMVNPDGPKVDPVYGYEVDKFEADHIVSMKEITEMDGFSRLTREQQIEILNLKDKFVGLGKSSNASKELIVGLIGKDILRWERFLLMLDWKC